MVTRSTLARAVWETSTVWHTNVIDVLYQPLAKKETDSIAAFVAAWYGARLSGSTDSLETLEGEALSR